MPIVQTIARHKGLVVGVFAGFLIGFISLFFFYPDFQNSNSSYGKTITLKYQKKPMRLKPVKFSALKDGQRDNHLEAYKAFQKSCKKFVGDNNRPLTKLQIKRMAVCKRAMHLNLNHPNQARHFFERNFRAYRVLSSHSQLTGYYEPIIQGSRVKTNKFSIPIYRRPADLVSLINDHERAANNHKLSFMRRVGGKLTPYPTRRAIEEGALKDEDLELLYLGDAVDAFFMQIQGSGRIRFNDGTTTRIGYDGKNGHPYRSIGKHLKKSYNFTPSQLRLAAVKSWLRADKRRGQKVMWHNKSFVFFKEHDAAQSETGPIGAEGVSLTPRRSLAVDGSYHQLGLPIWLEVPTLTHHGKLSFRHLMIGQDVGSAIKGAVRGDIYWGSGQEAGEIAGGTNHKGRFTILLPR